MRAAALVVAVALTSGCAGKRVAPAAPTVVVTSMQVEFPVRERGALAFSLRLPADALAARAVSWQLYLDDVLFASGLDGAPLRDGAELRLETPLLAHHLAWREGETRIDVGLRGEVDVGQPERLRFRERRELTVQGRPLFNTTE